MDIRNKALRTLQRADTTDIGIAQEKVLQVLRQNIREGDEWISQLVQEITTHTGKESTQALLRLLYLYGVGTIVEGRIA